MKIFGGLRVWRATHEVDPGPPRQRVVLALLVAAAGEVVTAEHMVNVLWPTDPPVSATNQVQRLVGQVRRTLEPSLSPHANGQLVLPAGTGYRIAASGIGCDLFRFRELAARADECVSADEVEKGCRLYVEALDECRGPLLAGLDPRTLGLPEIVTLERERESVVAAAAAAGVEHRQLPPQLIEAVQQAVARAPLNEALHEALLRVLAATGRRADALTAYDTMRRSLAEELGVDPSPQLVDTFHQLLTESSGAQPPAGATPPGPPRGSPRPAQLPRPPAGFVERSDVPEVRATGSDATANEVKILAIGGMAGIGKTAFAVHRAHQLTDHFPDGQLYLDLRGFSPDGLAVEPADALARVLDSLGEPASALVGTDVDARAARYRSLIAERRMLMVFDNARDSAHVRPLLPGSPTCLVMVTSRKRLTSLVAHDGAQPVDLDRLSATDARALLAGRIGPVRVATDPHSVERIIAACGGLPLALAIVAGRMATDPSRPLEVFAAELHEPGRRLDALSTGEPHDDLRTLLSWSYRALSADAARLLRHVAAHPGPEASLPATASVTGLTRLRTGQLADELATARLLSSTTITRSGADRYVLHDLVREYAGELLDDLGERARAERRFIDHYVLSTRSAFTTFGRTAPVDTGSVSADLTPEEFGDTGDALAWYARERPVLTAAVDIAIDRGALRSAAQIVLDRRPMSSALDPLEESLPQVIRLLDAGSDDLPPAFLAELHRDVALRSRDEVLAERHRSEALSWYRQAGDAAGQSNVFRNMTAAALRHGDLPLALAHAEQAHVLAQLSDQPPLAVATGLGLAGTLIEMGRFDEGMQHAQWTLAGCRSLGLDYLVPPTLTNLATAHLELGRPADALAAALEGLTIVARAPDDTIEFILVSLAARAAWDTGDTESAANSCDRFDQLLADGGRARLEAILGETIELDKALRRVAAIAPALQAGLDPGTR